MDRITTQDLYNKFAEFCLRSEKDFYIPIKFLKNLSVDLFKTQYFEKHLKAHAKDSLCLEYSANAGWVITSNDCVEYKLLLGPSRKTRKEMFLIFCLLIGIIQKTKQNLK